ncbi:TPA: DUF262 domain-containing protein [Candidatus Poribacteria bacterium]|nr:DUF262 domain-containing protein [Candidatus Poribacteria bacterium]
MAESLLNLLELMQHKVFKIPKHQRGFNWGKEHVKKIFEDLEFAVDSKKSHYMGPITTTVYDVEPTVDADKEHTLKQLYLEDGQQRMTSLLMIVAELLKCLEEKSPSGTKSEELVDLDRALYFKKGGEKVLRLRNENDQFHQYFGFIITGSPSPPADKAHPMTCMDEVKTLIEKKFANYTQTELEEYARFILLKTRFVGIELDEVNKQLAFDAINSRGLPLSEFDKVKNYCMMVGEKVNSNLDVMKNWFKSLTAFEDENVGGRGREDSFITDFYSIFSNQNLQKSNIHNKVSIEYFDLLKNADQTKENSLLKFVSDWPAVARSYAYVQSDKREYEALWRTDKPSVVRYITVMAHMKFSTLGYEQIIDACEKYVFRMHLVMGHKVNMHKGEIIGIAHQIYMDNATVEDVLNFFCDRLKKHAPMQQILEKLSNGEAKYPWPGGGVKGWGSGGYYFLYEYELHLSNSPTKPDPAWNPKGKHPIEHILPQTHRGVNYWERHWSDEREADSYLHRLGNLTLTNDGASNTLLGNKSYLEKRVAPNGTDYCYSDNMATASERQLANKYTGDWTKQEVIDRDWELLEFAYERWRIPCECDLEIEMPPKNIHDGKKLSVPDGETTFGSPIIPDDDKEDDGQDGMTEQEDNVVEEDDEEDVSE